MPGLDMKTVKGKNRIRTGPGRSQFTGQAAWIAGEIFVNKYVM